MQYRRAFTPGGRFFFTLVTEKRRPILAGAESVDVLRTAFRKVRQSRPFVIEAIVIMPDHLHCIWTLPPGDADFATRWRLIKTWFTKHCRSDLRGIRNASRQSRGEQAIWQHRLWEHVIRDEIDFEHHVDYIHYNPVKHGYVATPNEWQFSSIHKYIKAGMYPPNWGKNVIDFAGIGHE